jgi:hypothetical protein
LTLVVTVITSLPGYSRFSHKAVAQIIRSISKECNEAVDLPSICALAHKLAANIAISPLTAVNSIDPSLLSRSNYLNPSGLPPFSIFKHKLRRTS